MEETEREKDEESGSKCRAVCSKANRLKMSSATKVPGKLGANLKFPLAHGNILIVRYDYYFFCFIDL